MKNDDYVKAYSDMFIKFLFGKEGNEDILLDFINDVQSEFDFPKIKTVDVKNPFNPKRFIIDKGSYLDLKAVDETGKHYNIEVQSTSQPYFMNRILYYWSRLFSSQIEEGESYSKLKPTISINVLNFRMLKDNKDLHNLAYLALNNTNNIALSNLLFIHFIELPNLFNKKPEQLNDVERWAYFFLNEGKKEDDTMEVLIKDDDILCKAHKEYTKFTHDDDLREIYEMRVEGERHYITGIEDALERGERKKAIETAKKMKQKNMAIELIIELTGLTKEDIEKL